MALPIKPRLQAAPILLAESCEKEDEVAHQLDAEPQDAKRISSPASAGLIPNLNLPLSPLEPQRCQSVGNSGDEGVPRWMGTRVRQLSSAFNSQVREPASNRNSTVCQAPLALPAEDRDENVTERKVTPREKRNDSADRITPRIRALSVGVEAVMKARASNQVKKDSDEVVHRNPIFLNNDKRLIPDKVVLAGISYLLSEIAQGIFFNCEKAAEELSVCILRHPDRRQFLINTLIQLREKLEETKNTARFDKVLILVLEIRGNEPFLLQFFKHPKADLERFAPQAASRFSEHKESFPKVIKILSRIMHHELRFQKRETLFRQSCISSALFRELGAIFCSKELNTLKGSIADALNEADPSLLCLDYNKVKEALRNKNPSFASLNASDQEPLIQAELASNAERFIPFARHLLSKIYAMKISPAFSALLAMRRRQIISFVKKHPLKANEDPVLLSRSYISEVICLRILNPQILSIETSNKHLLQSLTKVVQCLAKEEPFGIEKPDLIFEKLNPLFGEFLSQHCQFIDRCSLN